MTVNNVAVQCAVLFVQLYHDLVCRTKTVLYWMSSKRGLSV